jgi:hypothetical protein
MLELLDGTGADLSDEALHGVAGRRARLRMLLAVSGCDLGWPIECRS